MIQNQMTVMSDAFASTGFSFELVGFDITVQDTWAQASAGSTEETAMKTALHQGSYQDLNLYFLSDLGEGLLGFCYFPTSNPSAGMKILDGCIMLADSMPGGAATNYDMGLTAVHEVG
ncbi:MAG: zinc metalloprotease, partial [Oxalobacteraceae bacterium]